MNVVKNGRPVLFGMGEVHEPVRVRKPVRHSTIIRKAREAAIARVWRPEWGNRPTGFGAARWRPEWGRRPVWFGAPQWNGAWGAQPAWWFAHQTAQTLPQPDEPDDSQPSNGSQPDGTPTPSGSSSDTSAAAAAAPGAEPATAPAGGMSTLAKIGIAAGAVAVVGGTIAVIKAASSKK
jgi:hypothetical protein